MTLRDIRSGVKNIEDARRTFLEINAMILEAESRLVALEAASVAAIDHGILGGLADDDHTQYLLADGTRTLTGNLAVTAAKTIDGRDVSVDGTKLDKITIDNETIDFTAGAGQDNYVLTYDDASGLWSAEVAAGGASDHGALTGLADDDHPQYLLTDGTRTLTGDMLVTALKKIDGRDLSVDGAKLDTIETSADVTDATNVAAAGAVMQETVHLAKQAWQCGEGSSIPAVYGTTSGKAYRTRNLVIGDNIVFEFCMPSYYGGGGIRVTITGSMASGIVTNYVSYDISIERLAVATNIHGASGFAAANGTGDILVPATTAVTFEAYADFTDGADMDSVAAGEWFRVNIARSTPSGTSAGGTYEMFGIKVTEN